MAAGIAAWLAGNGLERYAPAFERNGVDLDVLPDLSDTELERLGVTLGDRKRLARALASLRPPAAVGAADEGDAWTRHPGERKPVTMLFADVTGSTALTRAMDAEDAHEVLYGAVQRMCAAVQRNRGTVCRFMGDGVMAMFGAPVAFEDHSLWACRAALQMRDEVAAYGRDVQGRFGSAIQARIGLHAGEVVVLRVGEGEQATYDASGATVALAARMEQTAAPGTVQLTASTHALVSARFVAERLEPVTAKGFDAPVPVMRLLAEQAQPAPARPFVGRRAELAQLRAALDACMEDGTGRVLYLRGEPGIGKSRLVETLSNEAGRRGFRVHRTLVLDFGTGKGRDPVRLLVRDLLGLAADSDPATRQQAVAQAVSSGPVAPEREAHLCDLVDVAPPHEQRAGYESLDASTRARQRAELLATLVSALANDAPRLLVVEDVHWAPATIRGYLGAIAATLSECPVVLAVTSRIEGDPLASGLQSELEGTPMTVLTLGPLSMREARELADLAGIDAGEAVEACVQRSGRNPLFLEHLLASLRERTGGELPTSVQTSVAARVDALDPGDKTAVQAAAVLGQRFEVQALRALLGDERYDCARLVARGLIKPDGEALLFSHALVQEAVLGSLLRADRRALHERAAAWYAQRDPILYANHLDRAQDPRAAGAYLEASRAEAVAMRFVFARDLAQRGIELAGDADPAAELHAQHARGLLALGEMPAAAKAFQRAAIGATDPAARCAAWTGVAQAMRNTGDYRQGLAALEEAQREAHAHGLTRELAGIHHFRGNIYFLRVDARGCEREQQRAMALARECGDPEMEALALSGLVRVNLMRTRIVTALSYARRCVDLARAHGFEGIAYGHLHMVGIGLHHELKLHEAISLSVEAARNAPRFGMPRQGVVSNFMASKLLYEAGRLGESGDFARRSIELANQVGERRYLPAAESMLAQLAARDGDVDGAQDRLQRLWSGLDETDRRYTGPLVLAALMLVARHPDLRARVIADGRALSESSSMGEFMLSFFRYAILRAIQEREWNHCRALAADLEAFTREESTPLTEFFCQWARAAAERADSPHASALATLAALRDRAREAGFALVLPVMEDQLG